jgi:hypothetical protein
LVIKVIGHRVLALLHDHRAFDNSVSRPEQSRRARRASGINQNLENVGDGDLSANAAHRGQCEKDKNLGQRPLRTQTHSKLDFGFLTTQTRRREPAG